MHLKVMRRLTKILLLLLFSTSLSAQSYIFESCISNSHYKSIFEDSPIDILKCASDSTNTLTFGPKLYAINSSINKDKITNAYLIGLSLKGGIKNKFKLLVSYDYLNGNFSSEIKKYQDSLGLYFPGFGDSNKRFQFNARYFASEFIKIDLGNAKHFIGDGYQSLLLSDVASEYPYLKISTEFGPIRYYNLYTTFINPNLIDFGRKKHATIHYLNFSITPKINFGLFESILWQSKTEAVNKGYEFAYLNPVIFYRPVEFSKKSDKGNALIGANFNIKLYTVLFYGQLMLDDLNISRQKDNDDDYQQGFFQNKYGYQLGFKGKIKSLNYLFEFNQVQPYTYGHRTILQNYSHMNQALSHPLGANFKEFISILEFRKGNWNYHFKSMIAFVGLDSLGTHYGQDIFQSDIDASTGGQYSYGNYNGQGVNTRIISLDAEVSIKLKSIDIFGIISCRTKKSDLIDQTLIFYSLGVRTFPFSSFNDY